MNWVDIILALVLVLTTIAGWNRGFILGSLDLLTWTGSLILGYIFYAHTAKGLDKIVNFGVWLFPVSFLATAIFARILIGLVTKYIIRSIPDDANHNPLNKFLGIIPGAVNGWLSAVIISALLFALPLKDDITTAARNSRYAGRLAMQSEWAHRKLAPVFNDVARQTMNSITIHPKTNERVLLPFTYNKAEPRPNLETQMLEMVNKERSREGLQPLQADPEMTRVARAHSADMFSKGYFAHIAPDGKDPFDRMKDSNVSFASAGENLALAPTLEIAHTNLMNSPGHKANILNPAFGRLGIGIMDGGIHGLMISQEFRN